MADWQEGIFFNTSDDEYHSIEGASSSRLGYLRQSGAHMKARIAQPKESDALDEGKLIHEAVLEPRRWTENDYVRGPVGDRRTKAVKEAWDAAILEHGVERVIRPTVYDTCHGIAMAVKIHGPVSELLEGSETEVTIMWEDPDTGVQCKGRIDILPPSVNHMLSNSIGDVKSTVDASMRGFAHHYYRFDYYRQMAFYLQGLEVLGHRREHARIVAVEKTPPFGIGFFRCDEGSLDAGFQENQVLLRKYAEYQARGKWDGYTVSPQDLTIPSWAYAQVDDFVTQENEP